MNRFSNTVMVAADMTKSRILWVAFVLGALSAFGPLSIDMYLPSLPTLADNLHTTTSLAQLSLTACLLGLAVGQLVAGPLSDVRGRRGPLVISLILYAAASLLCVFAPNIGLLITLRFVQGLTGSAGIVISRAVARDLYSGKELTRFFSLLMLVNGVAPIAAPVLGGVILNFVSWRGVFMVLCLVGVAMLIAVVLGLPETLPVNRRSSGGLKQTLSTLGHLFADRRFMGYAFSQALITGAMFAYIAGSPFVLQDIFGVSPQTYSIIFAVNGLGIVLFSQLTGRLVGRFSERQLLLSGLVIAVVAGISLLTVALTGGQLFAVLVPLFFIVSCVGIVSTTTTSLAMQSQQRSAGSASAMLGLLPLLLGSIASPLVGLGSGTTPVPMAVVIAIAEIGALLSFLVLAKDAHLRA
ncbi:multidrug effflux MFS transporter [Paenibacillus brasilensis]|uniref:Bcr/CflA family efflux transporter n=1 Tax=Paenibacillus brasilensis TaxID=128574 RepID=A0ABU0L3Q6_9BACL|nr:multidrug effflux MFS transporter [Paenibacillus brasilensis]MDQ0495919.1 DHA1 family bicyclomycin/chloramphenicol resistance-like MFS transporter [Paenibacillus brasilensis]